MQPLPLHNKSLWLSIKPYEGTQEVDLEDQEDQEALEPLEAPQAQQPIHWPLYLKQQMYA